MAHGRRLARRRWIQRGSAALAAVVLIVVAVVLLDPIHRPVPQAAPAGAHIRTDLGRAAIHRARHASAQSCSSGGPRWSEVASSYLDPTGEYFSGFGYSYDNRYDTPGFWSGHGGALAFQMFRLDKGATEVYSRSPPAGRRRTLRRHHPPDSVRG